MATFGDQMATPDVKIPLDWLNAPHFDTRSSLLDTRRQERRELALAVGSAAAPPHSCDKRFARSETIFRDAYRRSGVFVRSPRQQAEDPPPMTWHPRAVCSGAPAKSALLAARQQEKRLASLKFEPPEIERLADIPKADQLADWWKRPAPGYVEDPANATFYRESLRLQLARHGMELGPVDPAKTRAPASVDERRRLREKKSQLAGKVTHISHVVPVDYGHDGVASLTRAPELFPQERLAGEGGVGGVGFATKPEPAWTLPVSPIKVPPKRSGSSRRTVENLFLESTSERILLDQLKNYQRLAPPVLTATAAGTEAHSGGRSARSVGDGTADTTGATLSPIAPSSESGQARSAFRNSIRCGGFS